MNKINTCSVVDDAFSLDDAIFAGLAVGSRSATAFVANTTGFAVLATDHIIYQTGTGKLFRDADGGGAATGVHFATITANLAGFGVGEFTVV